ncbi:extracellular solute-binding protein [Minwuia thermotolerans]|uniref:Fatty acid hydroxylase domain-containing protein n=1 Tax=Minwuia thermotolerans TaxID=2056226 RepID=A0A2M9FY88_9PROT|nr:extracellular solute-binding protein [Minwuia thermotolerans]PJK28422.1 hypothetical protein CVT23_17115 [Minwuia thermotolerans]
MLAILIDYLGSIADAFVNPQKRVFLGYLASALVIALAASVLAAGGWRQGLRAGLVRAFDRRIWFSRSARADYLIVFINRAAMMLIAPRLITHMTVASALYLWLHGWAGMPASPSPEMPAWAVAALFSVVLFLADDFSRYAVHRMMHRSPLLWPFHAVHHTAEVLTPLTVYRTHPVEGVLFALRSAAVQGLVIAGFVFFVDSRVDLVTVLGANALVFAFNVAGSNLRHSHVPIRYGRRLERFLISPAQHQIHHSLAARHHDRNFGAALAVWDWIGGSLVVSQRGEELRFGVAAAPGHDANSLYNLYVGPVRLAAQAFRRVPPIRFLGRTFMQAFNAVRHGGRPAAARVRAFALGAGVLAAATLAAGDLSAAEGELDIYSHRQPFLIQPFIDAFTEQTDVKVNVVYASKGLAQRLLVEGERSPADLVLTVDIGRLGVYADKDLLAKVDSDVLEENIPAHLRDPEGRWFGLSIRTRVVAVSRERVEPGAITRIEDLADPKWEGRICSRPGSHVYNRALLASLIAAHGVDKAEAWAEGLVANLARRPQGNDRAQIKAIHEGECDVAIINHYYYGKLKSSETPEHREWAESVQLVFTNQEDRGSHVNISGGGVAKHADNKADAVRFLEFLTSPEAQRLYAEVNTEYPVNPAVETPASLAEWGAFKADELPIYRIAELAPEAQKIIDRVGW